MRRQWIAFLTVLLAATPAVSASQYRLVQQWVAADGLPAETVSSLALDRQRQLWMATYDGIVRYQGFDFRHFNRTQDPGLPGNRFARVFPSPDRGVVVQLEDGRLGYLDEQTFQPLGAAELDHVALFNDTLWFICLDQRVLRRWSPPYDASVPGPARLSTIAVDHFQNRLLIGTLDGTVYALGAADQRLTPLLETGAEAVVGLAAGPDGQLLVVNEHRVQSFRRRGDQLRPARQLILERHQPRMIRAAWSERGWLLANLISVEGAGPHLFTESTLTRLPVAQATSPGADRSPLRIEQIDAQGRRWINDGLQLFRDGELMYRAEERIIDFLVDPFEQIWLAQPTAGLRLLKKTVIEMFGMEDGGLADPNITLVALLDDSIMVGSWVQLSRLDPATGAWESVLDQAARDVLADNGGLLIGTHGICRIDEPGSCQPIADFPAPTAEVLMLHRDAGGQVWAGTDRGLYRRDLDGRWQQTPVHAATVRTVLEDATGRLLFGTNGQGILVLDSGNGSTVPNRQISPAEGLSSPFVRSLLALSDGSTLVGTEDAGLCLLARDLAVVRCLSSDGGLPHHSAHFMVLDEADRLWVNTNGGVYWVDLLSLLHYLQGSRPARPDFYRLGRRHGLASVEGNGGVFRAGARTADGRIWFPNQKGLVSVRPQAQAAGLEQALSTQLRVPGQQADGRLHLPRHARHLEVELTAIALAEPENVQFRYRFRSDQAWTEVGHRRTLNFRDLQPGRHNLEVSARYVNTTWSGQPQRLSFSAGYRLHEHPGFHALIIAASLSLMLGIWQIGRTRQHRLEQEVQDRSRRLSLATDRVASLSEAFQKVDIQHRTALQAVSRELRSVLSSAMEPLLQSSSRAKKTRHQEIILARTHTLEAMLDQIGTFVDTAPASKTAVPRTEADSSPAAAEEEAPGPELSKRSVDLMALIRVEVLLHLADPDFSVELLASRLGLSRSVLYRQVAEVTASSPAELIRDIRLEEAMTQLRTTDHQVSCIAYATGFRSVSAFSRAFTKKTGLSPRQWRGQLAEQSP